MSESSSVDDDFKAALQKVYRHLQGFYQIALDAKYPERDNFLAAQFMLAAVEGALVASKMAQDSKPYHEVIDRLEQCI